MQAQGINANWKRNAGFFIAGQFLSLFGSMLVQFAITWQITLETQSGAVMTLFTCASMLPMVLISPFAGVWADRYNRKHLINIADAAIAFVTLLLAAAYYAGFRNIWLMLVVVVARSFGQGVQSPAVGALIPQIVPQEHLARFNGLQSAIQSLTLFAAPMASGALLTFLPIELIFFIDVATAAIGIAVVFIFVKVSGVPGAEEKASGARAYFHELMEGLRFIGRTAWLKMLIIYFALFSFFVCPAALLTPLQVVRSFGNDVWRLTAIELLFSAGAVLGGIMMSLWGGFRNRTHTMIFACTLFSLTTILLGVVTNFWVYLGVMLVCGLTNPMFNTPANTILQTKIEPQMMGRTFSVMTMLSGLALPLGMVVFGPLGDKVPIEWLLVGTGSIIFLGGFTLFACKPLIKAGEPAPADGEKAD